MDSNMPGAQVAVEMGLGKTFTSVATAMMRKLLTEKSVMGLLLSMLWGNTIGAWASMAQNNFPGIIGEDREWYLLQRLNSVPRCLIDIQTTPPQGHPPLTSALEPILTDTTSGVAEVFKCLINKMTWVING